MLWPTRWPVGFFHVVSREDTSSSFWNSASKYSRDIATPSPPSASALTSAAASTGVFSDMRCARPRSPIRMCESNLAGDRSGDRGSARAQTSQWAHPPQENVVRSQVSMRHMLHRQGDSNDGPALRHALHPVPGPRAGRSGPPRSRSRTAKTFAA